MYVLRFAISTILIALLCSAAPGCSKNEKAVIKIAGSTTILPFMTRVSQYYSGKGEIELRVNSCGSLKGVEGLLAKECDVAMCSSPITPEILAAAASAGIEIRGFPFAYDLIVPIVHPSNPVKNLSLDQLAAIYQGTVDSWADVGGESGKIDVVARAPSSGTREVWKQAVLKSTSGKEGWAIQDSNSGVLAYVAQNPGAIGYISVAILNHEVKALSVDGVAPTIDNAKAGRYPISRELVLYVDHIDLPYPVKSLIVFVLSSHGQQLVRESAFIPRDVLKQK
jgi:phosphate transport system substrate-binding protein